MQFAHFNSTLKGWIPAKKIHEGTFRSIYDNKLVVNVQNQCNL